MSCFMFCFASFCLATLGSLSHRLSAALFRGAGDTRYKISWRNFPSKLVKDEQDVGQSTSQ